MMWSGSGCSPAASFAASRAGSRPGWTPRASGDRCRAAAPGRRGPRWRARAPGSRSTSCPRRSPRRRTRCSLLIPDPTNPGHDATGQTIYFGVVPTGSSDVNDAGHARFNDRQLLRDPLFRPPAPGRMPADRPPVPAARSPGREPTETYQLASHFDLRDREPAGHRAAAGSRAAAVRRPRLSPGGSGGVRFQSPPRTQLALPPRT